jgi:hypothetical protein
MLRERSEVIAFTRDDIEKIVRYVAKQRIIGEMFIGKAGDQSVRWTADGGVEVVTKFMEGDIDDVPPLQVPIALAASKKKKKK